MPTEDLRRIGVRRADPLTTRTRAATPGWASSRQIAVGVLLAGVLALQADPGAQPSGTTERVSVDSAGNQGNDGSGEGVFSSINTTGRFVAFSSRASNLVPGDTNGTDVFVHDRQTGMTERVSVDSAGNQGNGGSFDVSISSTGRFVAFDSGATNLVPGDTNGADDVFVHDRR